MPNRPTVSLIASAALLTSAAPVPPPMPVTPPQHGVEAGSPVRCRTVAPRMGRGTGARSFGVLPPSPSPITMAAPVAPPASPPAPPAPPAPPPPPPQSTRTVDSITAQDVGRFPPAIVVTGSRVAGPYGSPTNTERYDGRAVASVQDVAANPVSTFSVDVDTGSYANVRRFLTRGEAVPAEAARTEEFINYFRYDYPRPADRGAPFSVTTDAAVTPWNADTRLVRIGLRAYDLSAGQRPPANLVFLVDTSGSMEEPDKLPLVKAALRGLAGELRPDDRVSIVAYAGSAGVVLEPTADKRFVDAALSCLEAGGSTAGGQGIELAYATARAHFRAGAVNRIFLATDGDFNVGVSDNRALEALVKRNRDDGITLTTLGFGTGNFNDAMMERIADVGNGNYAYIDSAMEAKKVLADELSATLVTVAKDVKVQVEFNPAAISQYRLIGYENRALAEQDFSNDAVDAGDMGAGHQVTALYEVVPAGAKGWTEARRYPANRAVAASTGSEAMFVKLRYKLPDGTTSREITQAVPAAVLRDARPAMGDMAFVAAVAAFGQKLRGDTLLGRYGYGDAVRLAGSPRDYWRQEFVKLAGLAGQQGGGVAGR